MAIWDTFMLRDEGDMLECRLTELADVVDRFVIVEADITHTRRPKRSYYRANRKRFARWKDQIVHVWATGLDLADRDPFSIERQQREWTEVGLEGAAADDIVLHSDIDEIPHPEALRGLRPESYTELLHRLYCFAVDWQHPQFWAGTVAARFGEITSFATMRDYLRAPLRPPTDEIAGWHFTWVGGTRQNRRKLASFCHPEQTEEIRAGLDDRNCFRRNGVYIGGVELEAVEVDETWPRWITERRCPSNWFRPPT